MELSDITEVKTVRSEEEANEFLKDGWVLLDVQDKSEVDMGNTYIEPFVQWYKEYHLGKPR